MRALFPNIDLVLTSAIAIGAVSVSPKTKLKKESVEACSGLRALFTNVVRSTRLIGSALRAHCASDLSVKHSSTIR
jgi:hypothetical protein